MNRSIHTLGIFILASLLAFASSCHSPSRSRTTVIVTNQRTNLPPGQAKKVYGQQSAKDFAPGQQKKKGGTTVVVKN